MCLMLEQSYTCPAPNYLHIMHSQVEITSVALQLNYITNMILEIKMELTRIQAEVKETKK